MPAWGKVWASDGVPRNCEAPSVPPAPPRRLSRAPRPSRGHLLPPHLLETWWRRRRFPRGSALRARSPPTWARPRVQQPRRAGGGASGRPRPSFPAPSFAFVCGGGRSGRGALAPPRLHLCSCAPHPGGRQGSAPCGGARGPRAVEAARPLQSVTCPHAARGPRLHVPRGGGAASEGGRESPCPLGFALPHFIARSPPLLQESGTN